MPISKVTTGSITDSVAIDTDTLVVDGTNNRVGIGTSSPSYKTEISDGTVTFGVNPLSAYSTVYAGTTTNHGMNFITNGNSRLIVDSSGRVTMPYQPSFSAYGSVYTSSTWGAIGGGNWSSVAHNIGSHFNSSNGRFTVPVAGRYIFTLSARAADNATSLSLAVRLRVNGSGGSYQPEIWGGNSYQGSGNRSGVSNTVIVSLGVNDYVEMGAWISAVSGYRFAGHFLG